MEPHSYVPYKELGALRHFCTSCPPQYNASPTHGAKSDWIEQALFWGKDEELAPHQTIALNDFKLGDYLDKGKNPTAEFMVLPLRLENFKGSIVISGAVGIGKSSLLRAVESTMYLFHQGKHLAVFERDGALVISVNDFSSYISKALRDITVNAHFHAAVFYRECYEELWNFNRVHNDLPWLILWDRYPLENIVFGRDPALDPKLLFAEFWPTKSMWLMLHKLFPSHVYFPTWLKNDGEAVVLDKDKRKELVLKRSRCDFEIAHAEDDFDWFYRAAQHVYSEASVRETRFHVLDLRYYASCVATLYARIGSMISSKGSD
jgi:hypothetical protein